MRARMGGADPVILAATSDTSRQRIVAGPGTGIHRLQDLKGKTIGVTQYGSEGDNFLRAALKSAGLQPGSDVTIFQTGGNPQTVVALLAGKLQAASMGRSTALAAEQKGAKELLNGHQLNFLSPSGTLATTTRNIQRDPNTVLRFMSAYVEGIHYFKNNRERSIRIMQKYMGGLSESSVAALYDEVKDVYRPLPFVSDEAMQTVLDRETDPKAKGYKPGDFIDMSYLRKIEKSGLVAKLYGNK
jgi:ABC-type nitrate/sulfonate/bicarbonate transport system substrate-binding protein